MTDRVWKVGDGIVTKMNRPGVIQRIIEGSEWSKPYAWVLIDGDDEALDGVLEIQLCDLRPSQATPIDATPGPSQAQAKVEPGRESPQPKKENDDEQGSKGTRRDGAGDGSDREAQRSAGHDAGGGDPFLRVGGRGPGAEDRGAARRNEDEVAAPNVSHQHGRLDELAHEMERYRAEARERNEVADRPSQSCAHGPGVPLGPRGTCLFCERDASRTMTQRREAGRAADSSGQSTPRYPTASDEAIRSLSCIGCSKGCGRWILYAPEDREQEQVGPDSWDGFVRCPCGVKRVISCGSFREDYPSADGSGKDSEPCAHVWTRTGSDTLFCFKCKTAVNEPEDK